MRQRFDFDAQGVAALVALSVSGCSAVLGIKDLPALTDAGSDDAGTDAPEHEAGVGTAEPDASDAASAFLGVWQVSGGTQIFSNCTFPARDGTDLVPTTVQIVWVRGTPGGGGNGVDQAMTASCDLSGDSTYTRQ